MIKMEIGFSTLSMLNKNLNEVIEIASDNDFSMIEILAYRNKYSWS